MKIIQVVNDVHSWILDGDENEWLDNEDYAFFIKEGSEQSISGEIFLCYKHGRLNRSDLAGEYELIFEDVHLSKDCHTLKIQGPHGCRDEEFSIKVRTAKFNSNRFKHLDRDSGWVKIILEDEDEDEYYW